MLHCGVYSVLMDAEYRIDMPGWNFWWTAAAKDGPLSLNRHAALPEDRFDSYPVHVRCRGLASP
jgi:hypothetical protein